MSGKLTMTVDLSVDKSLLEAVEIIRDMCEVIQSSVVGAENGPINTEIRYLDGGSKLSVVYEP